MQSSSEDNIRPTNENNFIIHDGNKKEEIIWTLEQRFENPIYPMHEVGARRQDQLLKWKM